MKVLLELAWAFSQVAVGAFGGGLSTLPLIEYQLVKTTGWLTPSQFNQVLALSQVTPGPIAVNAATFVGFQQAGVLGSLVSTFAIVAVPISILCVALFILKRVDEERSKKFKELLRPIVAGLLSLSLVSPLTATVRNGIIAILMLFTGIFLLRSSKFLKKYPPVLLLVYGIIGSVLFS
ncbi:MAG: chromate transporter [Synergistaceae bacterium]|nr:chromate transporter [Synergistaceae bacterium]